MLKLIAATLGTTLLVIGAVVLFSADGPTAATDNRESQVAANAKKKDTVMTDKTDKNNPDLKARLTPEQYRVTQQCGTEPAFSGKYYNHHEDGTYRCVVCDNVLFQSETKFESGSGWPSFFKPVAQDAVKEKTDTTFGMTRTEITCGKCGAHLGHVFPDGPRPTGLRYCVNSASLDFKKSPADSVEKKDPSRK